MTTSCSLSAAACGFASVAMDRGCLPALFTSLDEVAPLVDYSFVSTLRCDPEQEKHEPNRDSRQVRSGHYVEVRPTPLPNPSLVVYSPSCARDTLHLALDESSLAPGSVFARFFSGDLSVVKELPAVFRPRGWATGYALSIYGTEYYSNCPFKTGNGYGDGRAISILEVRRVASESTPPSAADSLHWEFQLKGGGRTPYCRGADGRAVLRSSIREFLASECMHALGVPTSRALCLYVSGSERVMRPWYSEGSTSEDPDVLVSEKVAITTRVAPSFLRVGQLELFARRARKREHPEAMEELQMLVDHVLLREYAELLSGLESSSADGKPSRTWTPDAFAALDSSVRRSLYLRMAESFAQRLSFMTAEWIRVGYCQGNFNADNCAAGGWTLDYGPFGFVEEYSPDFQMWVGGGQHFSFMNQPTAAAMNFKMFILSLAPLFDSEADKTQLTAILHSFPRTMQRAMESMLARKLGLKEFVGPLWGTLDTLMQQTRVDWTMFWRVLSTNLPSVLNDEVRSTFYGDVAVDNITQWNDWLRAWHAARAAQGITSAESARVMQAANPKFIPREWMLVEAYRAASELEDYREVRALYGLLTTPYEEHSGEETVKYFRKRPEELNDKGGYTHCSCSS